MGIDLSFLVDLEDQVRKHPTCPVTISAKHVANFASYLAMFDLDFEDKSAELTDAIRSGKLQWRGRTVLVRA